MKQETQKSKRKKRMCENSKLQYTHKTNEILGQHKC